MRFTHQVKSISNQFSYFYLEFFLKVNLVWAFVTCTRCISSGKWNQPLDTPCEICGENREFVFAPFKFTDTYVDVFELCDDPMAAFTDWVVKFEAYEMGNAAGDVENELGLDLDGVREFDFEENEVEESDTEDSEPEAKRRRQIITNVFDEVDQELGNSAPKKGKSKKKSFRTIVYAHAGNV